MMNFRFPLKKSSLSALSCLDTDDWHTAFHSTRPNLLREFDDDAHLHYKYKR